VTAEVQHGPASARSTGRATANQEEHGVTMASDSGRGMTVEERDEFLTTGRIFAKIATTMEDGWPVLSPVWYSWDGNAFLVVSKERTSLVQNLRRDARCGLLVDNPSLPYKRVSVRGEVEFLPDSFDWQRSARDMVLRYLGAEGMDYAEATFQFARVPFLVHPRKIATWNGGGFDRTFSRPTSWKDTPA
jgi:PPOX class probable F420-dependent enzyme